MKKFNFHPFPNLITERLTLRQMKAEDKKELYMLRSDEKVLKFINRPKAKTIDEGLQFIHKINNGITKNEWILWGITLKNKLIGTICLWNISEDQLLAEIGYELMSNYHGQGYMQEALTAVIKYGFENMKLHSIEAFTSPYNLRSIKLLERNEFIWKANFQEGDSFVGEISDMSIYTLLNQRTD
jgi:[ribosomal protein S5]-alanine N-acetyltransferase